MLNEYKKTKSKNWFVPAIIFSSFLASLIGFFVGALVLYHFSSLFSETFAGYVPLSLRREANPIQPEQKEPMMVEFEKAVIEVVEQASPSVVSIVITKDVPIIEKFYYNPFEELEGLLGENFGFEVPGYRQKGTQKQEVGGGTGFIVSEDGLIVTNKHVVADQDADYTVFTNRGEKYEAEVLARDPYQDIAILKVDKNGLPVVKIGNSNNLKIGQSVVAIGNVLGEFRNSVSVGVVSGLRRDVAVAGGGTSETLRGTIQTDAAINRGNSGGPLLNLQGEVIGINTAMATSAENIGFAIPINKAKRDIEQIRETGEISYPFIGIYYTTITPVLAEEYDLPVDCGLWVGRNSIGQKTEKAVFSGSPAEAAGLAEGDIITHINGEKISPDNPLDEIISSYKPGDNMSLRVLKDGTEHVLNITLAKRPE